MRKADFFRYLACSLSQKTLEKSQIIRSWLVTYIINGSAKHPGNTGPGISYQKGDYVERGAVSSSMSIRFSGCRILLGPDPFMEKTSRRVTGLWTKS